MLNYAINKLQNLAFALDPEVLAEKVLGDSGVQEKMVKLNQQQMYEKGVDSEDLPLGEYSFRTVEIKISKGQRTDHITLLDTGEFYDSMKVEAQGSEAVITGDMVKPDTDLETIYPKALGLDEESKAELRTFAKPLILDEIRTAFRA